LNVKAKAAQGVWNAVWQKM